MYNRRNKITKLLLASAIPALAITGFSQAETEGARQARDDTNLTGRVQSGLDNPVPNSPTVEPGDFERAGRDRSMLTEERVPATREGIAVYQLGMVSDEALAYADADDDGFLTQSEFDTLQWAMYDLEDGRVEATKDALAPLGYGLIQGHKITEADADGDGYLTVAELEELRDAVQADMMNR